MTPRKGEPARHAWYGDSVNKAIVPAAIRRQRLRAKAARKYKATTNSNHSLPVAPNLPQQNFHADRANQAWVADITYIATDEGWLRRPPDFE